MTIFDTRGTEAIKDAFALAKSTFHRHLTPKEEVALARAVVDRAEAGEFQRDRVATLALKDLLGRLGSRSAGASKQGGQR